MTRTNKKWILKMLHIKLCTRCRKYKTYSSFHKARGSIDGLFQWCKKCAGDEGSVRAYGGNRLKALKRDSYKCNRCGMTNSEHKRKYGYGIFVHHLDGDRKNNKIDNLITVCHGCHSKIHLKES